jgi:hypothetical protein
MPNNYWAKGVDFLRNNSHRTAIGARKSTTAEESSRSNRKRGYGQFDFVQQISVLEPGRTMERDLRLTTVRRADEKFTTHQG